MNSSKYQSEIAWFAPICNGDTDRLGKMPDRYRSSWANASAIVKRADDHGFRNILCPSSYQVGQDTWTFASACAAITKQISLLPAVRCGEQHPAMLARSVATLDHILEGRLTLNIISSNQPGEDLPSTDRYQRSREVIEILKQAWTQDEIDFQGQFYNLKLGTEPVKPYQQNGGPLLYFGGYSPPGVELCAQHCDVYLMWPETQDRLAQLMSNMNQKASEYDRKVKYGLRVHVIVRETEAEAIEWSRLIMSELEAETGREIRERALDAKSYGVSRQAEMREASDREGFVEDQLWTGIGRARSGCGAAIVGTPDQIISKLRSYMDMGIEAFILSGYPHLDECDYFARYVLPELENISLAEQLGRRPIDTPLTPLGLAPRM